VSSGLRDGGWAWGQQPYLVKKKIVGKPLRNSAGFCGGGQGLSWAVEPRKEEEERKMDVDSYHVKVKLKLSLCFLTNHLAMKAYWWSGGIAPSILDIGTRWR
jgi:hypothetical protein